MLQLLSLKNVGPAPEMKMELARRLNLITGDNGLGKSFLLDVAWWAMTRSWPHDLNAKLTSGYPARPSDVKQPASIAFEIDAKVKTVSYQSTYNLRDEAWIGKPGRPLNPGLVIYAQADGGFSVWDPARNYWKSKQSTDAQERVRAYVFSANDVWDGLEIEIAGQSTIVCNGLLRDWASWIREKGETADLMRTALADLAPTGESMEPGPLVRLSVNDARDIPSLRTPYSTSIPVVHLSSGVRRVMGLAYMLLWSWNEHIRASEQINEKRTTQVTMLVDEVESHLHPRWQRSILKSLLGITAKLHDEATVQLIAATHSPLILASAEPTFDPSEDAWFDLGLEKETGTVVLEKQPFVRQGTVGRWLTSEAFDLHSEGRSIEAEQAIDAAGKLLERQREGRDVDQAEIRDVDHRLRGTLPEIDQFWIRWDSELNNLKNAQ